MKNLLVLLVSLGFASSALAVRVKNCPENITVSIKGIDPLDDAELKKAYEDNVGWTQDYEEALVVRDLLAEVDVETLKSVDYVLYSKQNSKCSYKPVDAAEQPNKREIYSYEARLETNRGKDRLRVPFYLGSRYDESLRREVEEFAWVYLTVTEYTTEGLKTKPAKGLKILGLHDHGAPHTPIGWAAKPSAK